MLKRPRFLQDARLHVVDKNLTLSFVISIFYCIFAAVNVFSLLITTRNKIQIFKT